MKRVTADALPPNARSKCVKLPVAALLAALLCGLQGCVVIPTPEHSPGIWDNTAPTARRNVNKETADKLVPDQTRIEDVLLTLGEPDAASADGRKLVYRWEMVKAWVSCRNRPRSPAITRSV